MGVISLSRILDTHHIGFSILRKPGDRDAAQGVEFAITEMIVDTPMEVSVNAERSMEPEFHSARKSQHEMNSREVQYGHDEIEVKADNTQEPQKDDEDIVVHPVDHDATNNSVPDRDDDIVFAPCNSDDDEIEVAPDINEKAQEVMKDNLEIMKEVVMKIRADPEFAKSIYRDCPRLQYLLDQHPDLRPIFEDPELIAINFEKVYRDAGGVLPGDEPKEPPKLNFFYRILICIVTSRAFLFLKIALRIKRIVFFFISPTGGFQIIKNFVRGMVCGLLHPGEQIDKLADGFDHSTDAAKRALERAARRLENPKIQAKLEALLDEPEKLLEAIECDKVLRSLRDMNPLCAALMSSSEMMKAMVNPDNLRALGNCPALIAQDFSDPGGWKVPDIEIGSDGGGDGGDDGGDGANVGGWTPPPNSGGGADSGARSREANGSRARSGVDEHGNRSRSGDGEGEVVVDQGSSEPPKKRGFLGEASVGLRSYAFDAIGGNIVSDVWGLVTGKQQAQVGETTLDDFASNLGQHLQNMAENINGESVLAYQERQAQNQAYFLQHQAKSIQEEQDDAMRSRDNVARDGTKDGDDDVKDQDPQQQAVPSSEVPAEDAKPKRFGWLGEFGSSLIDNAKETMAGAVLGQSVGSFVCAVATTNPASQTNASDDKNPNAARDGGDEDDQEGEADTKAKRSWKVGQIGSKYMAAAQNVAASAFVGQDFADSLEKRKEDRARQRAMQARSAARSLPNGDAMPEIGAASGKKCDISTKPNRRGFFGKRSRIPPTDIIDSEPCP